MWEEGRKGKQLSPSCEEPFPKQARKLSQVPSHPNSIFGHMSLWYLMVNRFNLLGVLYLLWFVTLLRNNIFKCEMIDLEKSKTLVLSGTCCIVCVVLMWAVMFHGILYLYTLSGEKSWRGQKCYAQQLNFNDRYEANSQDKNCSVLSLLSFSTRRDCCLENNFRKKQEIILYVWFFVGHRLWGVWGGRGLVCAFFTLMYFTNVPLLLTFSWWQLFSLWVQEV